MIGIMYVTGLLAPVVNVMKLYLILDYQFFNDSLGLLFWI
jgi:hypothetical protein